jgi:hypothetical protein
VIIDRPGFMRAPTSCEPSTIQAIAGSAASGADLDVRGTVGFAPHADISATLSAPFQVEGCDRLGFAPKLALSLMNPGKHRREFRSGGHPELLARLAPRPGDANVQQVRVTLPLSLALDPGNAESLCEYADGLADRCPASSVVGAAHATTPLLDQPLDGKVYFVKGVRFDAKGVAHRTLPTLLVDLRGQVNLQVRASSAVDRKGRLVTTFAAIPDAPVSGFDLRLDGGRHGILVVSGQKQDLCRTKQVAVIAVHAHSGKSSSGSGGISSACPNAKHHRTRKAGPRKTHRSRRTRK